MIKEILTKTEEWLEKSISHLRDEFLWLQAWKASPALVENIMVNAYWTMSPLKNNAAITCPEAQQIHVSPWDKWLMSTIEKAIRDWDMWFNPLNNWSVIIVSVPALTEEKRRDLTKIVYKKWEETKISIRNLRQDAKSKLEKLEKDKEISEDELRNAEEKLQKLVDEKNKKADEVVKHKEEEIMKV